jgi:integrase
MSVFRDPRSPFWRFDFQIGGHRFFGSTKTTTRREAEAVARAERERAREQIAQERAAATSMRLDDICGRWWQEIGQHLGAAAAAERQLERLIEFFGKDKLITEITGDDVARLVAWRRGHRARKNGPLLGPFAVNDTTGQLKMLFTRAKAWGLGFSREPRWKDHWLRESQERVRELVGDEGERLEAETRDDYLPFFDFLKATGLRWNCEARVLRWSEVNWQARQIVKPGKGGRRVTVPITSKVREILWPLQGHHPEYVFTYVAQHTRKAEGRVKGERYPLTLSGVNAAWRRLRERADITGFRLHDFRHDFGTKVLRLTGNLKLTQRAMNHADIKTTARYAHVLDEDVAAALEAYHESPNRSPTRKLKAG